MQTFMKYNGAKRIYIDGLILLLIGISGLLFLRKYVTPLNKKFMPLAKLQVSLDNSHQFLYVANDPDQASIRVFHTDTLQNDAIATISSKENISYALLLANHILYTHGDDNSIIDIRTKKIATSSGDYISPNGIKYLSIKNLNNYYLAFAVTTNGETNDIPTGYLTTQLNKILGWSQDSNFFYYTTTYYITKRTPMQATDHWMQKINGQMQPMSRVRTWTQTSTSSAQLVFQVDTKSKTNLQLFSASGIGTIHDAFYDPQTDQFYLITDQAMVAVRSDNADLATISLDSKVATATASMIFATSDTTHRFLHSDGKSLSLFDMDSGVDQGLFYASNEAALTPLALTGNMVIFSLWQPHHIVGELLDIKRQVRSEFVSKDATDSAFFSPSILFVSWVKSTMLHF